MERLMFGWHFEVDSWSRFWRWNLIKICVWTCNMNSTLGSVVPLAMFSLESQFRCIDRHGKQPQNESIGILSFLVLLLPSTIDWPQMLIFLLWYCGPTFFHNDSQNTLKTRHASCTKTATLGIILKLDLNVNKQVKQQITKISQVYTSLHILQKCFAI